MLTILEGSTFCISDDLGDIAGETSRPLRVRHTLPLPPRPARRRRALRSSSRRGAWSTSRRRSSSRNRAGGTASRTTRSPSRASASSAPGCRSGSGSGTRRMEPARVRALARARRRTSRTSSPSSTTTSRSATRSTRSRCRPPPRRRSRTDGHRLTIEDPRGDLRTRVRLSRSGRVEDDALVFDLALDPHERWDLSVDVSPVARRRAGRRTRERRDEERETIGDAVAAWTLRVPRVRGGWESLRRAFDRSIADLAALRMRTGGDRRPLFAAGMPWFMTVFGRDTSITSLQTLLLGPELAVGALEALAELQSDADDPSIDAEPGKIVHEVRGGRAAEFWFARYYGTVDATPLFLVLLSETWRWTDDAALAATSPRAGVAGARVDRRATVTSTATGSSSTAAGRARPRRTSRGRTRATRSASTTGATPSRRSRPSRCRATSTRRSSGLAELAREVWRDRGLAERLEREADGAASALRRGVLGRGSRRVLRARPRRREAARRRALLEHGPPALERDRARRSASASIVDQLLAEPLWSGWGIRTMASDEAAYNPISYHNGTVWPHDTALAAWGLARHGYVEGARRIGRALIEAAGHFDWSLPEVFAGYARDETPFPIAYPTAARPQAWAAGTPILLVRVLLGLEPDRARQRLVTTRPRRAPELARRPPPRGRAGVTAGHGPSPSSAVRCPSRRSSMRRESAMNIGLLCPVWFRVPPEGVRRDRARGRDPRGRPRRRRPRRDALRVGRLAVAGALESDLPHRAERVDRPHLLGDAARALRVAPVATSSTSSTTTPGCSASRSAACSTCPSATPSTARSTGSPAGSTSRSSSSSRRRS